MPQHHNGWVWSEGPATYIAKEPLMSVNEYHSYRLAWLARYGDHQKCDRGPLCPLRRYQPPPVKPKEIRQV